MTAVSGALAPSGATGGLRRRAWAAWQRVETRLDGAFGARANPLRHLGGIAFFLFWIVAASGVWVYVLIDTSVEGAWRSVEELSRHPVHALARSLHRYASDAMVVATLAHIAREWLARHEAGFRWFSWLSGVPLLVLLYASGIGGFWLVWDELALFSVTATAEWIDVLRLTAEPFARNFTAQGHLVDRLFTLFIFLHIGIPLALLGGMWVHVQRLARPSTQPPAILAAGVALALVALSFAAPVASHPPAAAAAVPASVAPDWFILFAHPLMYATSPALLWILALAAIGFLGCAPWLTRARPLPAAVVSPKDCNGCGRCFVDCPYSAIELVPHSTKARAPRMAKVDPALCAACGLCAGACPSSTPFRASERFDSGIDLPDAPIAALREELERALDGFGAQDEGAGRPRIVVFGCVRGVEVGAMADAQTAVLSLRCTGMLPPSFVEYALRSGAEGVLVTGCAEGACEYRFGQTLVEERFAGSREPRLRANVPRERLRIAWCADESALLAELASLRARVAALGPHRPAAARRRVRAATEPRGPQDGMRR